MDDGDDVAEVLAGGELGDDAAVVGVEGIWEATTFERTSGPPRTMAAAVSSQEDSMPRMRPVLFMYLCTPPPC